MIEILPQVLPLALVAATPLLLCVQGELVVQRSGMINLGVEGMLLGAAFGATLGHSLSGVGGSLLGALAGAGGVALLFGWFTIHLRADQIVTGTALNLLALGATGLAYRELQTHGVGMTALLRSDLITPLAWLLAPLALLLFLWSSTAGLRLRATGEYPPAVAAAGWRPSGYRWLALAIQAGLVALAGMHLALVLSGGFAENMSAGRGYIALAVVIFGRWRVGGVLLGTIVFGLAAALQYAVQARDLGVPFHLLLATPYGVTLLILCGVTGRVQAPQWLGRS